VRRAAYQGYGGGDLGRQRFGETATDWVAVARMWEIGADGKPLPEYGEDGKLDQMMLSKLTAEYRCIKEAS
jgi:hypothetical protein